MPMDYPSTKVRNCALWLRKQQLLAEIAVWKFALWLRRMN
jgi:hypothetical protein